VSLALVSVVLFGSQAGIVAVLLPTQVAAIDPQNKVGNLAIVSAVAFGLTLFAQPLVGALSDRTRSPLGRRVPWALLGAVVSASALAVLGNATSILIVGAVWAVALFALNAVDISISAAVPDRIPARHWPAALAVIGVGTVAGSAIATVISTAMRTQFSTVYAFAGVALVGFTVIYAVVYREPSSRDRNVVPLTTRGLVARLCIYPRDHPAFAWAFAARFLFILGYSLVYTFQLYLVTDLLDLGDNEAARTLGAMTVVATVGVLLGIVGGGWWANRTGKRRSLLVFACVLLIVALLAPVVSSTPAAMMIFSLVKGVAFGIYLPVGSAVANSVLPDRDSSAGKDLGVFNIATNAAQAAAPALAGVIVGSFANYTAVLVCAVVIVIVSGLAVRRLPDSTNYRASS